MSLPPTQPVVRVENLALALDTGEPVIEDVSFQIGPGEILGVVGESGSGKSTLALALLGYARPGVHFRGGTIEVGGENVVGRDARTLRGLRGKVVSYVPQDPGGALNPSLRIGDAILDVLRAHRPSAPGDEFLTAALARVELHRDRGFDRRYPHQLSGGQQQRVTIAMATVCEPPVAVLDEPTTGLDVLTQDRVLSELLRLRADEHMAMVYVSHDLAVVARMADQIVVMYAGRVLEAGPTSVVLEHPRHPYTQALVAAIPDVRQPKALRGIGGVSVGVGEWPAGCPFAPRCEHRQSQCESALPTLQTAAVDHAVRCCRWQELALGQAPASGARAQYGARSDSALLAVTGLEARYRSGPDDQPAVRDVSFAIEPGQCVALVGESGSGKSTIARCIAGLHVPSAGTITFDGQPVAGAARARPLEVRRRIQIVFQNPYQSLNPRQRVRSSIERPLRILRRLSREAARREVDDLLARVRLPARLAERFPAELSGGERQRVAIARALAAKPDLLVCDEVTSALDVSVQAAVLELLQELRAVLHLSMLFITHNLGVVACIADAVLVMDRGTVCETGPVDGVLGAPNHEYTRRLLKAAPSLFEERVTGGAPADVKATPEIDPLLRSG
jgi:peptide/nickel transport system ATP-binding protein